jgi:hypothetical protein
VRRVPDDAITVSMPYHGCPETIERAVASVLAQTVRGLTLVVVNDGDPGPPWSVLGDIDDPRLICFDLATNRGRYFADAVVLGATRTAWFFVHDADDWSDNTLLETYVRAGVARQADAVFGAHVVHGLDGAPPEVATFEQVTTPVTDEAADVGPHQALFRTELLREIGGNYSGLRVGADTLLVNLVRMVGRVEYVDVPLYHRVSRVGSLTTSPATGFGSTLRWEAAQQIAEMYTAVHAVYAAHGTEVDRPALTRVIRRTVRARITPTERRALASATARLRARLDAREGRRAVSPRA